VTLAADHTIAAQRATSRTDQEIIMAIGSAVERGSLFYVFGERGMTLFSKARGSGPNAGLLGFTGSTVTARYGSVIYTYDEKRLTLYAKAALWMMWAALPLGAALEPDTSRRGDGHHDPS
jgi:hypothetical protein